MGGFIDFLKGLGAPRLVAMLAVTLSLIGFFGFVALRVSDAGLVPVFSDLTLQDSSAVIKELEAQNIPYQTSRDGSTIMVPSESVAQVRMKLAEQGLPSGGGVGWEIFDKGDGLSSTSFLQNVNRLRALEGELARSIRSLDRVAAARVHLVVPERPLFARDAPKPTASIVLRVSGDLGQGQVRAIVHLVASAVQGLDPEAISIVDETGRLLADGANMDKDGLPSGAQEREAAFERRVKDQVQGIVERVVGAGRARAEVNATFDYSKVTNTSDTFDPDSRVVRSTQTSEEKNDSTEGPGTVSVSTQLPNQQGSNPADPAAASREKSEKANETVNYEISRSTRTEVLEAGRLKKVSVAVLVDGIYASDPSGSVTYAPRAQEELDRIAALVRSAIGFDQGRGDQIEVVNLRFAEPPGVRPIDDAAGFASLGITKNDLMQVIEMIVLGIVSLLVLLLVVRPLVRRILTPEQRAALPALAPTVSPSSPLEQALAPASPPDPTARMIELSQVNGKVHAQSLQKVGELAQRNPAETVSIIRQWLAEPA
ncbi:flagellar M-ring protein [Terrihabitans soli]|uniref:Flagellar M-ring protein n=1 Tax=Terrihabitans soli TaxID=708113 RepID=A0A6S6QU40_9HYPH|nr:flagellar basal-body MS-ring/collar protein FliF [Terrihabitans soli]BCJ89988.1 flagellar M-ring protein [Terrihabitans soli]